MLADYPVRPAYFSQKFIRLMVKSAAAQHIGTDAFALLTVIATTEDARRYAGPVAYFNEQLMSLLGFGSRKRLVSARKRAIEAGWLHYRSGGKGVAGLYFVSIPHNLENIPDGPSDESEPVFRSDAEHKADGQNVVAVLSRSDTEHKAIPKRNGKGTPNIPIPSPIPNSVVQGFEAFWKEYPTRNGRKLHKAEALEQFRTIAEADYGDLMRATKNLAASGQLPKDAFRWLRKPSTGRPEWREWIEEPESPDKSRPELRRFAGVGA